MPDPTDRAHEVRDLGRVPLDLPERSPDADRARNRPLLDDEARDERREPTRTGLPPLRAWQSSPRVAERERDRAEREMELARERNGDEAGRRQREASPLERQERRGQEEGDEPEEVPRRLADAVRHEAEDEAADERRRARQAERAQPPAPERARRDERQQDEEVVRPHVPEGGAQGPVRPAEQPALHVRRRLRLGAEGVRVGERRVAHSPELMADEPEPPAELRDGDVGLPAAAGGRPRGSGRDPCVRLHSPALTSAVHHRRRARAARPRRPARWPRDRGRRCARYVARQRAGVTTVTAIDRDGQVAGRRGEGRRHPAPSTARSAASPSRSRLRAAPVESRFVVLATPSLA